MAEEEEVPSKGVTLWYTSSRVFTRTTGKKAAELTLRADIEDEAVWGSVVQNFHDGFRVITVGSFKDEMILFLKNEMTALEERNRALEEENRRLDGHNRVLSSQNSTLIQNAQGGQYGK